MSLPPVDSPVVVSREVAHRKVYEGALSHIQLSDSPDALSIAEQLKVALNSNLKEVLDAFQSLDLDSSGIVTRAEFHRAMRLLGLVHTATPFLDDLFTSWDGDGDGEITLQELTKVMNGAQNIMELRDRLAQNSERVATLFKRWDVDGDGEITREECVATRDSRRPTRTISTSRLTYPIPTPPAHLLILLIYLPIHLPAYLPAYLNRLPKPPTWSSRP